MSAFNEIKIELKEKTEHNNEKLEYIGPCSRVINIIAKKLKIDNVKVVVFDFIRIQNLLKSLNEDILDLVSENTLNKILDDIIFTLGLNKQITKEIPYLLTNLIKNLFLSQYDLRITDIELIHLILDIVKISLILTISDIETYELLLKIIDNSNVLLKISVSDRSTCWRNFSCCC